MEMHENLMQSDQLAIPVSISDFQATSDIRSFHGAGHINNDDLSSIDGDLEANAEERRAATRPLKKRVHKNI